MEFEPIIGLEVHIELKTKSKMFCGCPADYFGQAPNSLTCPVCLGLPGALPVPNRRAVEETILLGLALGGQINEHSKFDRKNYFYPDLPKGYQISQYDEPIASGGRLKIKNQKFPPQRDLTPLAEPAAAWPAQAVAKIKDEEKVIRIRRVHLEEDTGKLLHSGEIPNYSGPQDSSLIDFNRSGVPLVEIVTEPDFRSALEAKEFLKKIQSVVRYLDISEADMEKGSMRIEPSVSLRRLNVQRSTSNDEYPNYRVEIKNINSFRFAQKAIDYEIDRQGAILGTGQKVNRETRGWSEVRGQTFGQRTKEEDQDYRYFPEPDIPAMVFDDDLIAKLRRSLPELPDEKVRRYREQFGVREAEAELIAERKETAALFEILVAALREKVRPQSLANLFVNRRVDFEGKNPAEAEALVRERLLDKTDLSEAQIMDVCREVMESFSPVTADFRNGKNQALDFLLGQCLKRLRASGRADPRQVREILLRELG